MEDLVLALLALVFGVACFLGAPYLAYQWYVSARRTDPFYKKNWRK